MTVEVDDDDDAAVGRGAMSEWGREEGDAAGSNAMDGDPRKSLVA